MEKRHPLKPYQSKAIDRLLSRTEECIEDGRSNFTLIFQAPTGSGKTFTMSQFIPALIKKYENTDFCFIWVSVGTGGLHIQSYESLKATYAGSMECVLIEDEYFGGRSEINNNEIVIADWEELRAKDKETGKWKNVLMKDKETNNFRKVLENTREAGRKIVLIIDECHASSSSARAKELRDEVVKPYITLEMSATPVLVEGQYDAKVIVNPTDVINQGMIKKEIYINPNIDKISEDEMNSQELILEAAYQKQIELKKLFKEENVDYIEPLVLIQIPNSTYGDEKLEFCRTFLKNKGLSEDKKDIAIWLSEEKVNLEKENINALNGKTKFLIFKQAIDTGWDCPRAHILVRFRDIKSIVFEVQTLGRILRMPEAKHYNNDALNRAYVYTNIKSIEVKKEIYNPNIIKSLCSHRRDDYKTLYLESHYRNRVDYGDLTSSFYSTFEKSFTKYFDIDPKALFANEDNRQKVEAKGVDLKEIKNLDKIIKDSSLISTEVDKEGNKLLEKLNDESNFASNFSEIDLQRAFETLIGNNLNGFAPKRSIPKVKESIYYCFKKYLDIISNKDNGAVFIQSIVIKNQGIFSEIIDSATLAYKSIHEEEVSNKCDRRINEKWEIEQSRNYNPQIVTKVENALSLYQPFYVRKMANGNPDQLEIEFMDMLLKHKDQIDWFWQNGQEHMESNFGIFVDDKQTFQPDFIVKFKNGKIGIFDTKGIGRDEADNERKSNTLISYINKHNKKNDIFIGGLVVKDSEHFKYYDGDKYVPYKSNPEIWKYFESIFR